ncbi:MAG TPA: outer membrane protein assembly factor BamA, partial [Thermodesulfobacteriota bacterium]|nr:outer membrane protein assembly factor BamA [Thermodesulfobacteriota bacterium]
GRRSARAVFPVRAGQPLELVFEPADAAPLTVRPARLRAALELGPQPDLSPEGLSLLADRLVAFYRRRGRAWAAVSARLVPGPPVRRLVFRIAEGPELRVAGVAFRGNASVGARRLAEQMLTRPRAGLGLLASGIFDQAEFEEDLEAIRTFYRRQGFLDVRIAGVDFRFNPERTRMWITVTVDEGPRYRVAAVELAGVRAFPVETLRRELPLATGAPFSLAAVDRAVEWLVQRYLARGYLAVQVVPDVALEREPPEARVTFRVTEGPVTRVGRILYRGNFYTRNAVLARELTFRSGDPFSPAALLESQRNIGRLGFLRNVTVRGLDEGEAGAAERDVLVSVEEASRVAFSFGVDYSVEEQLRVSGAVTHRSLFGTARSATLSGLAGGRESRYALDYRQPYVFGRRLDALVAFAYQDREEEAFSVRRTVLTTSVERPLGRRLTLQLGYQYESARVSDVEPGTVISERDIGTVQIGALRPTLVWDRRDDPFNPTRGTLNTLSLELANRGLLSEVEFVRLVASSAWFFRLDRRGRLVLGASVRAGYAVPYGVSDEVPLIRRFFLGGATTVRGFDRDEISPRGADGAPTGGTVSLNENVEFRFPLPFGFGGAFFFDAGNVWRDEASAELLDQRAAYGAGLRYLTPVGPIRLDYGRKLDRQPGEAADRFHFSIGYVF